MKFNVEVEFDSLCRIEHDTEAWHAYRGRHITASNLSKAMGIDEYKTRSAYFEEYIAPKSNRLPFTLEQTVRMASGRRDEPVIRRLARSLIQSILPAAIVSPEIGIFESKVLPWMSATPDGVVWLHERLQAGLEIKRTDADVNSLSVNHMLQVLAQSVCMAKKDNETGRSVGVPVFYLKVNPKTGFRLYLFTYTKSADAYVHGELIQQTSEFLNAVAKKKIATKKTNKKLHQQRCEDALRPCFSLLASHNGEVYRLVGDNYYSFVSRN